MPAGSSSAAPVTRPGPSRLSHVPAATGALAGRGFIGLDIRFPFPPLAPCRSVFCDEAHGACPDRAPILAADETFTDTAVRDAVNVPKNDTSGSLLANAAGPVAGVRNRSSSRSFEGANRPARTSWIDAVSGKRANAQELAAFRTDRLLLPNNAAFPGACSDGNLRVLTTERTIPARMENARANHDRAHPLPLVRSRQDRSSAETTGPIPPSPAARRQWRRQS
ncbi:hypothetical protein SAMN05192544_102631 [Paraburkholderia hospita]|nr:hypothetical protein SAMN05192544_102631 [Paraburkholderia hospita]